MKRKQSQVLRHIRDVQDLCFFPDELIEFSSQQISSSHPHFTCFRHMKRMRNIAELALNLDKLNLHKLFELAYHTLPMFGSIHGIGEIKFESKHQSLKRILRQGNGRNIHIRAMKASALEDWEARLAVSTRNYPHCAHLDLYNPIQLLTPSHSRNKVHPDDEQLSKSLLSEKMDLILG